MCSSDLDAQEVCAAIRRTVAEVSDADAAASVRIQYGGSVKAGTISAAANAKRYRVAEIALADRVPLVMMLEGAGFRADGRGHGTRTPTDMLAQARCSGRVPIVTAVLGASAGHGALVAPISDFAVMSAHASIFTAGPPVVLESLGESVTKEELGGPQVAIASGLIHNGADDNASGTASIIAMARAAAADRGRFARTLVFVAFAGEERGLLGSTHYTTAPTIPLGNTVAMINLGMVGRFRGTVDIAGLDSAPDLTEAVEAERVRVRLLMVKPMPCDNKVEFSLKQEGAGTRVTWAMSGAQPFMGKLVSVFSDCERMVGGQFEKGLGKLKSIVEKSSVHA